MTKTRVNGQLCNLLKREALRLLLPFLDSRENPKHKAICLLGLRLEKVV